MKTADYRLQSTDYGLHHFRFAEGKTDQDGHFRFAEGKADYRLQTRD